MSCSDNNVKLIVLDRLQELKDKHKDVMQVRVGGGVDGGGGGMGGCSDWLHDAVRLQELKDKHKDVMHVHIQGALLTLYSQPEMS